MFIGRGGAGDRAADVRKGSQRGSSDVRGVGNGEVQCGGRGKSSWWRVRQAGHAIYR